MCTRSKRPDIVQLRDDGQVYFNVERILALKDSDPFAEICFCFLCEHPENLGFATRQLLKKRKLKDESKLKGTQNAKNNPPSGPAPTSD